MDSATPDNPRGQAGRPADPPPQASDFIGAGEPIAESPKARSALTLEDLQNSVTRVRPALPQAPPPAPPSPGIGETFSAVFANTNVLGSALEKYAFGGYQDFAPKPGYDVYANNGSELKGYEDHASDFTRSESPEQTQNIKNIIDAQRTDQDVQARSGWLGHVASIASGATDPLMLTLMLLPGFEEAGLSRFAKISGIMGTNVVAGEAQAGTLAYMRNENYTGGILPRIGANALLSGVMGGILTRVPKKELDPVVNSVRETLNNPSGVSTAGAMQVPKTTLADESIARGGQFIASTVGKVNPVDRILADSLVPETRRLVPQLVDTGGVMLNKNLKGVATPPSIEMKVKAQADFRDSQLILQRNDAFAEYKAGGGKLSGQEFDAEISDAMRNGDTHTIPEVQKVAAWARPMFDGDNKRMVAAGLIGDTEGKPPVGAPSYFPRVWDQRAIMNNLGDFTQRLHDWFKANPKTAKDSKTFIDEFTEQHGEALKEAGVQMDLARDPSEKNTVHLQNFIAPEKGKGLGRQFMQSLTKAADEAGVKITTRASPIKETMEQVITDADRAKLAKYYESHGFKSTGENGEMARAAPEPEGMTDVEIRDRVHDTIDRIQGIVRGTADIGHDVKNPGVIKLRKLDVPDAILKPYLSSDFEHVMKAYNRSILPHLEMHEQFGSVTLENEFKEINDAYRIKKEATTSNEEKAKLTEQHAKDVDNLKLLRDRALGQTGPRGNESLNVVRAAQLARSFNYLRTLGSQTLSALPDVGRLVTRYGLGRTSLRLAQYLTHLDSGMMKVTAQKLNTALDVLLHTRMHTLDGIGDGTAGEGATKVMGNLTANFTKITGIAHWDAMMRTLSAQLEQDALHNLMVKGPGGVSSFERAKLAQHGIGDAEFARVQKQWLEHSSNDYGLHRARTELWTDKGAARLVEDAVQRAGSNNAFYVGKGDLPGFANSEMGKFILQFKGFAVSSVNRLAIPLAQGLAHGDIKAANGLASMLALGALTYYTKQLASGKQPDLSPHNLLVESLQRSGILTYLPDIYDPVAGMAHLPRFSKFQDKNPLETAGGATFGGAATLIEAVNRMTKGNVSAKDIHKLRQVLPWNNVFYLTRLVNALEGKVADAVGAKGAPNRDFADYFNPASDAPEAQPHPDTEHFLGIEQIPNHF